MGGCCAKKKIIKELKMLPDVVKCNGRNRGLTVIHLYLSLQRHAKSFPGGPGPADGVGCRRPPLPDVRFTSVLFDLITCVNNSSLGMTGIYIFLMYYIYYQVVYFHYIGCVARVCNMWPLQSFTRHESGDKRGRSVERASRRRPAPCLWPRLVALCVSAMTTNCSTEY